MNVSWGTRNGDLTLYRYRLLNFALSRNHGILELHDIMARLNGAVDLTIQDPGNR